LKNRKEKKEEKIHIFLSLEYVSGVKNIDDIK